MPQVEAFGNALGQLTGVFLDALVDRFQCFNAFPVPGSIDANHVTDKVIVGHDYRDYVLQPGVDLSGIGTLHPAWTVRDDGAVVDPGSASIASPVRGLQAVLPHQAPRPLLRDRYAPVPEPSPDLVDPGHQYLVRHNRLAAVAPRLNRLLGCRLSRIVLGTSHAHSQHTRPCHRYAVR